jgi:hypothetical protein
MAYKQMDVDMLDAAQRSHLLVALERDVQGIAKSLSLLANHNAPVPTSQPVRVAQAPPAITANQKMSGEERDEETRGDQEHEQQQHVENEEEDEEDFDALIGETAIPQNRENDDDEIDLT